MEFCVEQLEERLSAHSAYFDSMVNLIPAQFYVVKEASAVTEEKLSAKGRNEEASEPNSFSVERVPSVGLSELKERLHSKLDEFRSRRKVVVSQDDGKEHNKRRLMKRQKRIELHDKGKKARKTEKLSKAKKQAAINIATTMAKPPSEAEVPGAVRFSRFEFSKEKCTQGKGKNLKRLLEKAESMQKKLLELKGEDEAKAEEMDSQMQWKRAVKMAQRSKLKDDPRLLRRSIRRKEKKQEKSRRDWVDRNKHVEEMKVKREDKRKGNITERIAQIKDKKLKKRMKRKGRI